MIPLRKIFLAGAFVALCVPWLLVARLAQYVHSPIPRDVPRLEIPAGAGLSRIVSILHAGGLAEWEAGAAWGFRLFGKPRSAKAGIYAFRRGERLVDVFRALEEGRVDLVTVTFPEGLTAREMAPLLEAADVTPAASFVAFAYEPATPRIWGLPGTSLEGFLFPDTYRFARGLSPRAVADVMVRRFRGVTAGMEEGARRRGLSLLDWVALASVVEKETGQSAERPLISAVFQNRLAQNMPLQSDPTVIYGIAEFDGNLRKEDLLRDTPYNTYTRRGLPAGPIASPGRTSLEAVLSPANVPYLYFVSRNDGSHVFTQTYAEHRREVARYQKGGRR